MGREERERFDDWLNQCPVDHDWQGYGTKLKIKNDLLSGFEEDKEKEIYVFYPMPQEQEDD